MATVKKKYSNILQYICRFSKHSVYNWFKRLRNLAIMVTRIFYQPSKKNPVQITCKVISSTNQRKCVHGRPNMGLFCDFKGYV